ncbi:hypothetical protein HJG60_008989 [Phyllostomus discolor]|uniref:Uncharacterized protein n=1 Tax=Phyllostomus discolor TaxID=89673 RepID=A0A834DCM9_9CHIR|nr:hypothetical protein HJG60_008989 [Phyllostomus discolor]
MLTSLPCLPAAYGVIQVKEAGGQQNRWCPSICLDLGEERDLPCSKLVGHCSGHGEKWDGISQLHLTSPLDFNWDCNEVNLGSIYDFLTLNLLSLDTYNFLLRYLVHAFCGSFTGTLLFLFIYGWDFILF